MGRIILVTGGCRSGKSEYARTLGETMPAPRAFVATCPAVDEEMSQRVRKHREARSQRDWRTIEEEIDIAGTLRLSSDFHVLLVDCLTLWVSNLMHAAEEQNRELTDQDVAAKCAEVVKACADIDATVIFVTDEVGMGIVPTNAHARLFRDLLGTVNQAIAREADEVTLVACGMPLHLKKGAAI